MRSGSSCLVPAEEALRAIRSTARPSPRRMAGWIQRPNEVVSLAVADRHLSKPLWNSRWDAALGSLLLDRAWRETVLRLLERPGTALGLARNAGLGPAEQPLVAAWARSSGHGPGASP